MILEIVILAMIAAFIGLRLYSVLGRRADHDEEWASRPVEQPPAQPPAQPYAEQPQPKPATLALPDIPGIAPAAEPGIRAIAGADRNFDLLGFIVGAKAAYEMILDAFWSGDKAQLKELCDDDVYASFAGAIEGREEAGQVLENKLIRIEEAVVVDAELDGAIERIAVRFVADIAAVTRDKDGNVIAGSLDDAIESRDIWTFERDVASTGPDWLLSETDEA